LNLEVSFEDCKRELLNAANAKGMAAYDEWRHRHGYEEVVQFVEGFRHRRLFELSADDIRKVMRRSGHALGDVDKTEAIRSIEDFTCPFALQHIFHGYLEERGVVPSWEEFDSYLHHDARNMWMEPLRQTLSSFPEVQQLIAERGKEAAWKQVQRAIRWRLGKFYLSCMRELDLIARLREMGVPLRYHVFADVLLRVDFWTGGKLACVYFENQLYRNRKRRTEEFFPDHQILHARIERQGFGKFWVAKDEAVQELAARLGGSI
jgi:hypothetical protein